MTCKKCWQKIENITTNEDLLLRGWLGCPIFSAELPSSIVLLLCLSDHNEKGANMNNRTMEYKWNMVGARIKIMLEEKLVDPPNEYVTPVNVPYLFIPMSIYVSHVLS